MLATLPSKRARKCVGRARRATARTRVPRLAGRASRIERFLPSSFLECGFKQPAHRRRQAERRPFIAREPAADSIVRDARHAMAADQQRRNAQMIVTETMHEPAERER